MVICVLMVIVDFCKIVFWSVDEFYVTDLMLFGFYYSDDLNFECCFICFWFVMDFCC